MNVGSTCHHAVVTIAAQDDLATAARVMREKHVGYLIVTEPGRREGTQRVIGVLTDRDIVVAVVAREVDPRSLTVGDAMTAGPFTAGEAEPVEVALRHMRELGIRRAPVVGHDGELKGVLSLDDVLEALAVQLNSIAAVIRNEQRSERSARP
jgi:CBS domain-containing protein